MKLRSFYPGKVFWRIFNAEDTTHVIGYRDGFIEKGDTVTISHPKRQFQLELKKDWFLGSFIEQAGTIWLNSDNLILNEDGTLQREEDAITVEIDNYFKLSTVGAIVRFFDLDASSTDSNLNITTTVGYSTSNSFSRSTTIQSSVSDEQGNEFAPKLEVQGNVDQFKIGVEVAAKVSSKIIHKIEDAVQRTHALIVSQNIQTTNQESIVAKAGLVTAHTVIWQRRYVTGRVMYGGNPINFDATINYDSSRKREEFDSIEEMQKTNIALYREYKRQQLDKVPSYS